MALTMVHPIVYIELDGPGQPWDKFFNDLMNYPQFPSVYRNWMPIGMTTTGRLMPLWSLGGVMSRSAEFVQLSSLLLRNGFKIAKHFCGAPRFARGEGDPPTEILNICSGNSKL